MLKNDYFVQITLDDDRYCNGCYFLTEHSHQCELTDEHLATQACYHLRHPNCKLLAIPVDVKKEKKNADSK